MIPYVKFIDFFKNKGAWKSHITNIESTFMRLLQIDNLFYCKRIISENGKNRQSYVESFVSNSPSPVRKNKNEFDKTTPYKNLGPSNGKNFMQDFGGVSETESPIKNIDFDREKSQIR